MKSFKTLLLVVFWLMGGYAHGQKKMTESDSKIKISSSTVNKHGRIALVIGVSNYSTLNQLPNDSNDVEDMAKALHDLNFDVIKINDPDLTSFRTEISNFSQKLRTGNYETCLLFYSGHGCEWQGINYLLPKDYTRVSNPSPDQHTAIVQKIVNYTNKGIQLDAILREINEANIPNKISFIDACRSNPSSKSDEIYDHLDSAFNAEKVMESNNFVFFASTVGNTSNGGSNYKLKNSVFTYCILRFINESIKFPDFITMVAKMSLNSYSQQPYSKGIPPSDFCFVESACGIRKESVKIGAQTWMAQNLDADHFINGKKIFQAKSMTDWKAASWNEIPAWCYYQFDSRNSIYGKIYNGRAITSGCLVPEGWHIPSADEWNSLCKYYGGKLNCGSQLKSNTTWDGAINEFNAMHGGFYGWDYVQRKDSDNMLFRDRGLSSGWWSSTEDTAAETSYSHFIYFLASSKETISVESSDGLWDQGFYVRCISGSEKVTDEQMAHPIIDEPTARLFVDLDAKKNFDIVKADLAAGADVNAPAVSGKTPFFRAIQTQNLELIKLFIHNGANINEKCRWNEYPIDLAVCQQSPKQSICKLLIDEGANVNAGNSNDGTILTKFLLNAFETINEDEIIWDLDPNNLPPGVKLYYCTQGNGEKVVCGYSMPTKERVDSNTRQEIVKLLLQNGATKLGHDYHNRTAYKIAEQYKETVLMNLLKY